MKKRSDGAAREAARRARQPAKPRSRPAHIRVEVWERMEADGISEKAARAALGISLEAGPAPYVRPADWSPESRTLVALRSTVKNVDAARRRLDEQVRRRDVHVGHLRGMGWSWERIAAEVGVSRQALRKRAPATPVVKNP